MASIRVGPSPRARTRDRLPHRCPDRDDVVAVDGDAGKPVGGGLAGDLGVQRRHAEGRGSGVEIVLADEHDGRALDGGELIASWNPAMVDRAVAEKGDGHVVLAARARADAGTDRVADPGGDDAVGPEQPDAAVVEVHGAAAPAATSVALAEELGHQRARRDALGERMAVPAMRGGDPVGWPQMRADADCGRLLADVEMQEARRLALAAGDLRRAFEAPQQHHLLIEAEQCVAVESFGQLPVDLRFRSPHRSWHAVLRRRELRCRAQMFLLL